MSVVKVLQKGQITLPKDIRKALHIHIGDTLIIEEQKKGQEVVIKKGKTIFDFAGKLPDLGMGIDEIREKAISEVSKENG